MYFKSYGITDIGKFRDENQDAFYMDDEAGIYIVADGMGGMERGGEAADFIVSNFCGIYSEKLAEAFKKGNPDIPEVLADTIYIINEGVKSNISLHSGSTIVLFLKLKSTLYAANLGDSPGYLCRDGKLIQVTREHNIAGTLVDSGDLTEEEAKVHPARHQLTAYVGMTGETTTYITSLQLIKGDRLLLCTDGLTGMVPEREIAEVIAKETDIAAACGKLLKMANDAGGYDNITIVLVEYC